MGLLKTFLILSAIVALFAALLTLIPLEDIENLLLKVLPKDIVEEVISTLSLSGANEARISGKVFSKKELAKFTGKKDSSGLYIAILGEVFDVSKGEKHYGPEGGYSFFAGRDGSRAFVTGEFNEEGLTEDLTGLSGSQLLQLDNWLQFYRRDYVFKGYLSGLYYDESGKPTAELKAVHEGIKAGKKEKEQQQEDEQMFPSCNSEWSQSSGSRVWCSDRSGGVKREWVGVPRQYYKPGTSSMRCACIRTSGPPGDHPHSTTDYGDLQNPNFKLFPDCDPLATSCSFSNS